MNFDDVLCGYSPLSDDRVKHVWQHGVFCLDSNFLLDVYRFTETGRPAFLKLLNQLKDRLFIPARVATEFARNRPGVITGYFEPNQMIRRKLKEIEDQLHTKHIDHPDKKALLEVVEKMRTLETDSFGARETAQLALLVKDPILDELLTIIGNEVGDPFPADELVKDYESRIRTKKPPFCVADHQKKDAPDGIDVTDLRMGDVAVWLETLAYCKLKKCPLIFVTGDAKENWWIATGERDVPQPLLVQEFRHNVGQDVLFYTSKRFLELSPVELGTEPSPTLVNEAKELERRDRQRPFIIDHFGLGQEYLNRIADHENDLQLKKLLEEKLAAQGAITELSKWVRGPGQLERMLQLGETLPVSDLERLRFAALIKQLTTEEGLARALNSLTSYPAQALQGRNFIEAALFPAAEVRDANQGGANP